MSTRWRRSDAPRAAEDAGLAAIELSLLLTVLLTLVAMVGPLAYVFFEQVQLGRTAGDVIRFASSRSDQERVVSYPGTLVVVPADALPGPSAIASEAVRAHTGREDVLTSVTRERDTACPSTNRVRVTLTTTLDLGPFSGFILSGSQQTLRATATSCEE